MRLKNNCVYNKILGNMEKEINRLDHLIAGPARPLRYFKETNVPRVDVFEGMNQAAQDLLYSLPRKSRAKIGYMSQKTESPLQRYPITIPAPTGLSA